MVGYGGSHQYRIWIPGTNKIKVSRDVRFVGEATRNMIQVGTVGAHDTGAHVDAAPRGDAEAHGDTQRKERIIYDTIEVLPPLRNEPVSESESESDSEDGESSESGDGDGSESDIRDNHEASQEPTVESEPFVSGPLSPKNPEPEIPAQRVRKPKPPPYDPASYVSAQNQTAKLEGAKRKRNPIFHTPQNHHNDVE